MVKFFTPAALLATFRRQGGQSNKVTWTMKNGVKYIRDKVENYAALPPGQGVGTDKEYQQGVGMDPDSKKSALKFLRQRIDWLPKGRQYKTFDEFKEVLKTELQNELKRNDVNQSIKLVNAYLGLQAILTEMDDFDFEQKLFEGLRG
jgi:hypothetical protein